MAVDAQAPLRARSAATHRCRNERETSEDEDMNAMSEDMNAKEAADSKNVRETPTLWQGGKAQGSAEGVHDACRRREASVDDAFRQREAQDSVERVHHVVFGWRERVEDASTQRECLQIDSQPLATAERNDYHTLALDVLPQSRQRDSQLHGSAERNTQHTLALGVLPLSHQALLPPSTPPPSSLPSHLALARTVGPSERSGQKEGVWEGARERGKEGVWEGARERGKEGVWEGAREWGKERKSLASAQAQSHKIRLQLLDALASGQVATQQLLDAL